MKKKNGMNGQAAIQAVIARKHAQAGCLRRGLEEMSINNYDDYIDFVIEGRGGYMR